MTWHDLATWQTKHDLLIYDHIKQLDYDAIELFLTLLPLTGTDTSH